MKERKFNPLVLSLALFRRGKGIILTFGGMAILLSTFHPRLYMNMDGLLSRSSLILDPLLAKSLVRTSGDGWTVNPDILSEVAKSQNYECKWIEFESTTGKTAKFCGHTVPDGVTRTIEEQKRFHHCNPLPKLWKNAPKIDKSIYVEVGANIGKLVQFFSNVNLSTPSYLSIYPLWMY